MVNNKSLQVFNIGDTITMIKCIYCKENIVLDEWALWHHESDDRVVCAVRGEFEVIEVAKPVLAPVLYLALDALKSAPVVTEQKFDTDTYKYKITEVRNRLELFGLHADEVDFEWLEKEFLE